MIIKLGLSSIQQCKDFADSQIESSKDLYAYRGEANIEKMKEDIVIGKMGEIATYIYLQQRGFELSPPDFKVYQREHKSFDADLMTTCGKNIHVKSQGSRSVQRYGASWLFQKEDKITRFPTKDDFIVMCNVHDDKVEVLGCVEVLEILKHNLFEEPKVSRYKHTKKALYLVSLKQSQVELFCLGIESNERSKNEKSKNV